MRKRLNLAELGETRCACEECKHMCSVPCWPTPAEAKGMLDAGMASRMMLDWWEKDSDLAHTYVLCGAEKGHQGRDAPAWRGGFLGLNRGRGCVLQLADGRCSVHDSGFKPVEARVSSCAGGDARPHPPEVRLAIAALWNTADGISLVKRWRDEVGYAG